MSEEKSIYDQELDIAKKALEDCHESLNMKSCMDCEKLFDCEIRKSYVAAVYNSMSKGETGGFEF
ncbi:MAG: hypothetical protein R3331_00195 [Sulfurospirillaceae bacterium]|nr:hypothetical protein [Sulfurospirillaceae bacterium]